jgi:hypothetical protein
LDLDQVSMGELVTVAAGPPRFRAKLMPTMTLRSELHTQSSREVGVLFLADDADTFVLHNRWVRGDVWSEELGDYTNPIWETVVLRSSAATFENVAAGPESTGRLEWSGGRIAWNTAAIDVLAEGRQPVALGVAGALVYTTSSEGAPHEFLVELDLPSAADHWQLKRSLMGPSNFTLARIEATIQGAA